MSNTEMYRPQGFDSYIGQAALKRTLSVYINSCTQPGRARPLPHIMLEGGPGMGKTSLAYLVAAAVDDPIINIDLAQMSPQKFISMLRRFGGGILFLDEIHRASKAQLEMLLKLMDEGFVPLPGGGRLTLGWLTIIAATTEPEKLPAALMQRFTIHPEFEDYTDEEAAQIVAQMARLGGVEIPADVCEALGHACAGTPRLARDLVMAHEALSYQMEPSVEDVLTLVGVDSEGLSSRHINYLKALDQMDGLAGERPLMACLQVSQGMLRDLERTLLKRKMITLTSRGRAITSLGDTRARGAQPMAIPRRAR
jgi:Holliday junction DNA helicase RuvB